MTRDDLPIVVIANPAAAGGKAAGRIAGLRAALERMGRPVALYTTEMRGHASAIARSLDANVHMIVAIGGDGTVNEIVNGIGSGRCAMTVVPAGTGNDFARLLGIRRTDDAMAAITVGNSRCFDIAMLEITEADGRIVTRRFINTMGVGFDAAVAVRVQSVRYATGVLRYLLAVIAALRRYRAVSADVVSGSVRRSQTLFLASIGNGTTSGGGFMLSPHADPTDGLLDLCTASDMSVRRIVAVLPKTFRGRHLGEAEVWYDKAPQHRITLRQPLPVHADGEIVSMAAIDISVHVVSGFIRVLVPPPKVIR